MAISFPFQFDTVHAGLSSVAGVCYCNEEEVKCEFRLDIGGLGIKSKVKEASLLYSEISKCLFWKSWFGAGVRIYPTSLKILDRFPAHQDDHLIFRVKQRDRADAELAASEIELRVIDLRRG